MKENEEEESSYDDKKQLKTLLYFFLQLPWRLQVFVFQCMSYCLACFLYHFVYSLLANVKVPRLPGKTALLETFHYQGLAVW